MTHKKILRQCWMPSGTQKMTSSTMCKACNTCLADSSEHLFPSAFGGRIEIENVLCTGCNNKFGQTIDASLIKSFSFHRNALEVIGDRGQVSEITTSHPQHGEIRIKPGFRPSLSPRKPEEQQVSQKTTLVTTSNDKVAKQYLGKLVSKKPDVTVTAASRRYFLSSEAEVPVALGGEEFYRACMKTILVFIEAHQLIASSNLKDSWNYVNTGAKTDTFNICISSMLSPWGLPDSMSEFSHQVLFDSRKGDLQPRAAISFFGCPLIIASFGHRAAESCISGVAYDPFGRQSHAQAAWSPELPLAPDRVNPAELRVPYEEYLGRVVCARMEDRERYAREEIIKIAMQPLVDAPDGEPIPKEVFREFAKRAAELFFGYQAGEPVVLEDPRLLQMLRNIQRKD